MGWLQNIFGTKPTVPTLPELSLPAEQQKAIDANIAAAPKANQLAQLTADQINRLMEAAIPGFSAIQGQVSKNLQAGLKGQFSPEAAQMAGMATASHALGGGYSGSGMQNFELARNYGIMAENLQTNTLSSAESWLSSMEKLYAPSEAIFTSMFITPEQEFAASTQERNLQFQRSWLQNQINAMPDPVMRGIHDMAMSAVDSYLGGTYSGFYKQSDYVSNSNVGQGGNAFGSSGGNDSAWSWGGGQTQTGSGANSGAFSGGTGALGGGYKDMGGI